MQQGLMGWPSFWEGAEAVPSGLRGQSRGSRLGVGHGEGTWRGGGFRFRCQGQYPVGVLGLRGGQGEPGDGTWLPQRLSTWEPVRQVV